tara:strand:- start:208 stop:834 length:627 start_codon:yes stop_codon:yes gene_type:complete
MKTDTLAQKVFPDLSLDLRKQIKYDWTAVYSTSSKKAADLIANIISNYIPATSIITDATSGIGGNTAIFSTRFKHVNAIEIDNSRFSMMKHNMSLYSSKNITYHNTDYLKICWTLSQDAIFIDPPWGGASVHLDKKPILSLSGIPIEYICKRLIDNVKLIALKVPVTYDVQTLRDYLSSYRVHHYKLRKMHLIVCSHPVVGSSNIKGN